MQGSSSIGDAARMIQYGDADVMVAGSAGSIICPTGIVGLLRCVLCLLNLMIHLKGPLDLGIRIVMDS